MTSRFPARLLCLDDSMVSTNFCERDDRVSLHALCRCKGWLPPDPFRPALAGQGPARRLSPHQSVSRRAGAFLLFGSRARAGSKRFFRGFSASTSLSFWFPLGFTYEVLRRARTGRGGQLPDWQWSRLGVFAREGAVKFVHCAAHAPAARRALDGRPATASSFLCSACRRRC